jgi:hypothetical protein
VPPEASGNTLVAVGNTAIVPDVAGRLMVVLPAIAGSFKVTLPLVDPSNTKLMSNPLRNHPA